MLSAILALKSLQRPGKVGAAGLLTAEVLSTNELICNHQSSIGVRSVRSYHGSRKLKQ